MQIPIFQLDAFTSRRFSGNPAAVCPLEGWIDDTVLQGIAAENNLSETAFLVASGEGFEIRWFTPKAEIDLCGHATLASAAVVFKRLRPELQRVRFATRRAGVLEVARADDWLVMDFPSRPPAPCAAPAWLAPALGAEPLEVQSARDLVARFANEAAVRSLAPDMAAVLAGGVHAVIVTAPGDDCDFCSRFFAPAVGVPEDPVTGSAHCTLVPYWAGRLGRTELVARQVSARGGELRCRLRGDRVELAGQVVWYLEGTIQV